MVEENNLRVAILTDSNSGISDIEAKKLGIFVIPMPIIIDDEEYFEGINITEEELCNALKEGREVHTSQPSVNTVISRWDELLEKYDEVLYIPMSSGLSGACMNAIIFSKKYNGKVVVVDNHRISVTLRTSINEAIWLMNQNKSASEIKTILEEHAFESSIYLTVNSLVYLKQGGRVSAATAAISGILGIKAILTIQGDLLEPFDTVRGKMKKCQNRMIEAVKEDLKKRFSKYETNEIAIGLAGAGLTEEQIREWIDMVRTEFPLSKIYYNSLSASVTSHTGPGAVGIGISFPYSK